MSILYILIPLALVLSVGSMGLFWWAVRDGQFDDLDTPALRVLTEERDQARGG